mmetsp:Transcript_26569/g.59588  ORF Transcript_26569/g.59588 Transcript_26569/m.59588 type:complete len:355 (+) Transcript_26569:4803-5867(+)
MYRAALPLHLVEGQRGLGEAAPQQVDRGQQLHTLPLELLHESVHPSQLLLHHRLLLELALCAHAPLYAAHQGSLEGAHLRLEQVQNARLAVQLHAHHVSADSARLQVAGRHPAQVLHELQLPGLELEPGCEVCHQLLVRVRPQVAQQQALGGDLPQQLAHLEARHGDVQRAQPVLQVLRGGLWRGHEQPQPPVHLVLALHAHHWLPREPVQPQRGRGHQQLLLRGGRVDLSLQVGPHLLLVHDRQLLALLHLLLLLRSDGLLRLVDHDRARGDVEHQLFCLFDPLCLYIFHSVGDKLPMAVDRVLRATLLQVRHALRGLPLQRREHRIRNYIVRPLLPAVIQLFFQQIPELFVR